MSFPDDWEGLHLFPALTPPKPPPIPSSLSTNNRRCARLRGITNWQSIKWHIWSDNACDLLLLALVPTPNTTRRTSPRGTQGLWRPTEMMMTSLTELRGTEKLQLSSAQQSYHELQFLFRGVSRQRHPRRLPGTPPLFRYVFWGQFKL